MPEPMVTFAGEAVKAVKEEMVLREQTALACGVLHPRDRLKLAAHNWLLILCAGWML